MSVISKLQIVLEANTTAFDRNLSKVNDQLGKFSKSVQDMHAKMDKVERKNREALQGLQTAGKVAAVGLGVMAVGIKGAVTAAVDFEKSMAGVRKVIDFETPEQFRQMEQDIIALSQRLPMAATDIAAIMEAAGQSGIARDELTRFAESAVKMGVAFDITAEEAGKAMAEMRASFGMTQTEVETLADQINYLGNNSTNSAPHIMEVVQRIGSLAEMANISSSTIAALTASMVGIAPEVAATSLKNFSLQLVKGESLSKSAKAAFVQMGLDYNQVAKDMQTDSEGTIRKVLEAVQKVPEHMRAAVLNDAFGSESIAAISQLVTNIDTVDKNLKAMGDSATYAGSMLEEFESMAGTSAAQMQLFDNNMQAMKIAFGTAFLPVLNQAMEAITPVIKSITDWAQKNPELVTTITAIVGGVLGAIAALGGLALAFTAVTGGIGAMVSIGKMIAVIISPIFNVFSAVKMFGATLAALGFPVTAVVVGIAALVAAGVALYMNWDTVKATAIEVWNAIPQYADQAWQWIQGVWGGIGAWFSGIWDSVVSSVNTAWVAIKQAFANWLAGMPAPVQEMVANIGSIFSGIASIASAAWSGITAVAQTVFSAVVAAWQGLSSAVSSAWQGIVSVATSVWDSVKSAVQSAINAIKPIITSVASFFSSAWNGLVSVAQSVWNGVKAAVSAAMTAIKAIFTAGLTVFASVFNAGFALVTNIFTTTFNVIKSLVRGDMTAVRQAFKDGFDRAVQIAKKTKDDIISALKDLGTRLLQMGRDAIQGLINGMSEKITAAVNKAQEIAGKVIGAVKSAFDIHSPSRVMKSLGEWVSEGLALGIDHKAPMVEKSAKKLAKTTKDALTSELQRLSRELFIGKLKLQQNPFAELTADIAFGKYGKHDTAQLLLLAERNDRMQKAVEFSERLQKVRQEIAEIGLDEIGLLELQRSNYAMINDENFNRLKTLIEQRNAKQNTHNLTQKIAELDEKILLVGKSELEVLQHQLNTAKEYEGVSDDIKQSYLDRTKALQDELKAAERLAKVKSATDDIAKHKHILANWQDKHATLVYDLAKDGYDASQIDKIVGAEKVKEQVSELTKLFDDLKHKKVFGDAINTANLTSFGGGIDFVSQMYQKKAVLDKVLEEQQAKLEEAREQGLIDLATYQSQERALIEQHKAKKRQLAESSNQALLAGTTNLMKMMYGEKSKQYKWAFGLEKAYAISRILMQNKVALANAWASAPFPANLGAVAKTLAETGSLVPMVNAIKPIGQAHDGIMSVPKSGTWNLEKGERVLPKHTAKALDDKLNNLQNGGGVVINQHITINADGSHDVKDDTQNQMGQAFKAGMLALIQGEMRQGRSIYNFVKHGR
ncbi:phage tail tape measure protein [Moraxella sp. ZY200743]|uniref:phage tail tape measure protein n=1 Tax=Moraxella sp. ZY200743 TaxID=2911970 RepID=UPI003D7C9D28